MLAAIGPVVRIVEVEQYLHAGLFGFVDGNPDIVEVGIRRPLGIDPDAHPYQVVTGLGEDAVGVLGLTLIAVARAAVLHFVDVGQVGAEPVGAIFRMDGRRRDQGGQGEGSDEFMGHIKPDASTWLFPPASRNYFCAICRKNTLPPPS